MGRRMTAMVAAALVAVAVNFFGVVFFFRPIAEADSPGGWLPPPAVGFLVYVLLSVLVLDWAARRFGKPVTAAWVIALAQVILIIDLVLRGDRGVATGAAGALLVVVTWTAMGWAYGRVRPEAGPVDVDSGKRLVRRFYEEVVGTGDVDRVPEFVAEECVETDGLTRVESGIDGMREHVRGVRAVYPDLRITVDRQIAEGEWVATLITARGTHRGSWLGMKPTGRPLVFTGVNVDRVVGGRIVEHGGAANMLLPFLEAGAIRVVAE